MLLIGETFGCRFSVTGITVNLCCCISHTSVQLNKGDGELLFTPPTTGSKALMDVAENNLRTTLEHICIVLTGTRLALLQSQIG
ncbi:CYTL1 domain-containing protein isoform X2 [Polypterus senegalus]|uniref:CYTL1 domain-containing protein isoform X2 n=1 Tax=Polypterus senegalus TaxID=55291 RepID=UPI00196523C6|nr:CYTL1 domain-containing protein isoform X2 [Polypterus senegalus]XP_039630459.1 CYTL1 domain-containing protein isoform X2 [Polypterus senegalus]